MGKCLTQEEVIAAIKKVHGDSLDLSELKYVNDATKVTVTCNRCGHKWSATPNNLKQGRGCPKCAHPSKAYTTEEFKAKVSKMFDYELEEGEEYKTNHTKLRMICPKHGIFLKEPRELFVGRGCPQCEKEKIVKRYTKPFHQFLKEATSIFGETYTYDESTYLNANTKMRITCKEHGDFWFTPHVHLSRRRGCPKCRTSKLETMVRVWLESNQIQFEEHYKAEWLGLQHLDFFLPQLNVGIECQGIQHYRPVKFFGGTEEFEVVKERDERKRKLCNENGVKLIYFSNEDSMDTLKRLIFGA